ncbi:MAG: hypothetical protein K9H49_11800 [Bacteroidales bacterium]|nr:hypothetical protein [Bacteroidales bacterium]MCF8391032.1 hypothetical protein [Bacteroidales bacterium]
MRARIVLIISVSFLLLNSCELTDLLLDEDPRDAITGSWKVEEDSELFKKNVAVRYYDVYITKDVSDSSLVWVDGFYELSGKVKMKLNGNNIEIPNQVVDGYSVEDGSGSIASDSKSIILYYYVDIGTGDKDVVRADYSRE